MTIGDYVWIIKPSDRYFGEKFIIRAVQTDFQGRATGYTVNGNDANGGKWRDYDARDVTYTTKHRTKFTTQMMLY